MENEKHPYQKQWEEYRRRRNISFSVFFSPFLLVISIGILVSILNFFDLFDLSFDKNFGVEFLLFIIWAAADLIGLSRFHSWPCPRCGQRFFTYSFWVTSPILLDKCRNCRLSKYYGSTFYY